MRLTLWPGAMPITFKTVAGEREYRIKEDVYAYLIQSKTVIYSRSTMKTISAPSTVEILILTLWTIANC